MLRYDVRGDESDVERYLTNFERKQVPFARALALTRTAKDVQDREQATMRRVLDSPTQFTINSIRVKPANKRDPEAYVWVRDEAVKGTPPIKYLGPLIYGGTRNHKRHEKALHRAGILPRGWYTVPGKGARLNRFGNLTGGMYSKILSDLRASSDPMQNRNDDNQSARFFVLRRGRTPLGIYERTGKKRGSIRAILHFIPQSPRYQRIFPFFRVADETGRRRFGLNFDRALREAMRTRR